MAVHRGGMGVGGGGMFFTVMKAEGFVRFFVCFSVILHSFMCPVHFFWHIFLVRFLLL